MSIIIKSLSFILILTLMSKFIVAHTHDCYYDETQKHVEYICDGPVGERFEQRTFEILYCHNYKSEINRHEIKSVGFRNCLISGMTSFNLWHFSGARAFNISYIGFKTLSDNLLNSNTHLERFDASHNQLNEVPVILFDTTPLLTEVDFSFNVINQIYPLLFDNTRKLKTVNFSYNMIDTVHAPVFSNLQELQILDLSNNNIDVIDSDLLVNNKKLKSLNLNNNELKRLDCKFLATLAENHTLNIFINTLEEVQTKCLIDDKEFDLDIIISPKETTTRLQVSDGKFKWTFSETDFTKLRHLNFSSTQIKSSIELINELNIDESDLIMWQLNAIEYLLAFMVLILIFVCVFFIAVTCNRTKNYNKNLSIFSVEQSLIRGDNQYQKISSQQYC